MFFVPVRAKASFISDIIFGNSASADSEGANTSGSQDVDKNSQSKDLSLEANVSSAVISQNKIDQNIKNDSVNNGEDINTDTNVNISSNNALIPTANHITGPTDSLEDDSSSDISVYVIRKGDTIAQIAEMFNVSANTILWANDMKKGDKLVEGDVLLVLPVSGVKHTVLKGQTLKGIAKKYNVDVVDIADFNGIASDAQLAVGDELIIPDGVMASDEGGDSKPAPKNSTKDRDYYIKHPVKDLGGYFINPVPGYKYRSQGIHGKNAVDLAAAKGTPILAAAAGTVTFARLGNNGGYGNLVIIKHANGTETLYAHQSKIATHAGEHVDQGEIIGYIGSTGHSTGPHLHYEVHGARNNGIDL